jgi:RHS repeat-associated protein
MRTYDKASQVSSLQAIAADSSAIAQYTYSYDADGRISSESRTPAIPSYVPMAATITYSADNGLLQFQGSNAGSDANGNALNTPIQGSLAALTYDARNRLTQANSLVFGYDAENNRILSRFNPTNNLPGKATLYWYAPFGKRNALLVSVDPNGDVIRYVYGLGAIYQETTPLAGTVTTRYMHHDIRGSTIALTEDAGTVTGRIEYGPFGELNTQTGDTATLLQFNGQFGVQTDGSALCYMGRRYYNPAVHRFLQADVEIGPLALPNGFNRYVFVVNNPVRFIDPSGQFFAASVPNEDQIDNRVPIGGNTSSGELVFEPQFFGGYQNFLQLLWGMVRMFGPSPVPGAAKGSTCDELPDIPNSPKPQGPNVLGIRG